MKYNVPEPSWAHLLEISIQCEFCLKGFPTAQKKPFEVNERGSFFAGSEMAWETKFRAAGDMVEDIAEQGGPSMSQQTNLDLSQWTVVLWCPIDPTLRRVKQTNFAEFGGTTGVPIKDIIGDHSLLGSLLSRGVHVFHLTPSDSPLRKLRWVGWVDGVRNLCKYIS